MHGNTNRGSKNLAADGVSRLREWRVYGVKVENGNGTLNEGCQSKLDNI